MFVLKLILCLQGIKVTEEVTYPKVFNLTKYKILVGTRSTNDDPIDLKSLVMTRGSNIKCSTAITKSRKLRLYAMDGINENFTSPRYHLCPRTAHTQCLIAKGEVCDGFSACLNDECHCSEGKDAFNCGDKSGCISLDQVCDGLKDCTDGSDECVCKDYVNCVEGFGKGVCMNSDKRICPESESGKPQDDQLKQCFPFHNNAKLSSMCNKNYKNYTSALNECIQRCPDFKHHCHRVDWSTLCSSLLRTQRYSCYKRTTDEGGLEENIIGLDAVCNGVPNCLNGADEEDCFNRFYCSTNKNSDSIHISRTCDSVPDCKDGSDECQNCTSFSFSSDKDLISNKVIRFFIIFQVFFIILFNGLAFKEHLNEKKETKVGNIDKFICLQLILYDILIGFYLIIIIIRSFQYYGEYCKKDHFWRTSALCNICGFIFSFSTHGSMFTAAVMAMTRCYNIAWTFTDMSYRKWIIVNIILSFLNFLGSLTPILPIIYLDDFFSHEFIFDNNFINPKATKDELGQVLKLYKNVSITSETFTSLLKQLSKMTTRNMYQVTGRLGFYQQTPLCVQNLFSVEPKLVPIKIVYVPLIFSLLVVVGLCYIAIIAITKKRRVHHANRASTAADRERRQFLSLKVTLVILGQMLCWFPMIIATTFTLFRHTIPQMYYELCVLIFLPMSSLLNPIFHSSILKQSYLSILQILSQIGGIPGPNDLSNTTQQLHDMEQDRSTPQAEVIENTIIENTIIENISSMDHEESGKEAREEKVSLNYIMTECLE